MKIGEMLISEGIITTEQLDKALAIQKDNPSQMIGEILLELGYIDVDKFTQILDRQLREKGMVKD